MKTWNAPEPFRQYIEKLFDHFLHRMGLGEFLPQIRYVQKIPLKGVKEGASMQIAPDKVYLSLDIDVSKKVYDKYWKQENYRWIALCVIHELAHNLTDPYFEELWASGHYEELRKINERQTERIARTIFSFVKPEDYLP